MRPLTATLLLLALLVPAVPAAAQTDPASRPTVVTSFDGTPIVATLHLPPGVTAEQPGPLVLLGHGWGSSGDQTTGGSLFAALQASGYVVLTWDARGFGGSGGEAQVDSLDHEARDVQALLDWAAEQPEVLLDGPGDPVTGMVGGSYGGGIQLATAAIDDRVDALAPEITWHDLERALYPNGVLKLVWLELLFGLGVTTGTILGLDPANPAGVQTGALAPELVQAQVQGLATNTFDEATQAYFRERGLAAYGVEHPVEVPTLLLQGTPDTLFTVDEAVDTFRMLRDQGTPTKLVLFCGGLGSDATTHGVCPSADAGDRARLDDLILRWFDHHLRGAAVDTGPPVEWRGDDGVWHRAADWPPPATQDLTAPVAGPITSTGLPGDGLGILALPALPQAPTALTVEVAAADDGPLVLAGSPTLDLAITGTGAGAHLFVRLVHREGGALPGTGQVLNQQETPILVGPLSEEPQTLTVDLVDVAATIPEGDHLDLQIASQSGMFTTFRGGPALLEVTGEVTVPARELVVDRVAGPDRTATAAELSRDTVLAGTTVVLARADAYPDALAGAPLARALGAPLLLTGGERLGDRAAREVRRLGATTAVLLGGEAALSPQVAADLEALGVGDVTRLAGDDRFATAAAIAAHLGAVTGTAPTHAYLVEGAHPDPQRGWPDAVAASALAAQQAAPVLLATHDELPPATAAALEALPDATVRVVGGPSAVADDVVAAIAQPVERIAGGDRHATSAAVADVAVAEGADPATTVLATSAGWPDALAAGPAAAALGGVLLLVDGTAAGGGPTAAAWLGGHREAIDRVVLAGGPAVLDEAVVDLR